MIKIQREGKERGLTPLRIKLKFEENKMIVGDLDSYIKIIDWLLDASKEWILKMEERRKI